MTSLSHRPCSPEYCNQHCQQSLASWAVARAVLLCAAAIDAGAAAGHPAHPRLLSDASLSSSSPGFPTVFHDVIVTISGSMISEVALIRSCYRRDMAMDGEEAEVRVTHTSCAAPNASAGLHLAAACPALNHVTPPTRSKLPCIYLAAVSMNARRPLTTATFALFVCRS